jgi:hypothetical protein
MPVLKRALHFERFVFTAVAFLFGLSLGRDSVPWVAFPVALVVFLLYPYWLKLSMSRRVDRLMREAHGVPSWETEDYVIDEYGMTNRDVLGETTTRWWACKGATMHRGDVYVDTIRGGYRVARRGFRSETELRAFVDFVNDHKGFKSAAATNAAE